MWCPYRGCSGWGFASADIQRGDSKSCCSRLCLRADYAWSIISHREGEECCVGGAGDGIKVFGGDVEGEIDERLTVGFDEC